MSGGKPSTGRESHLSKTAAEASKAQLARGAGQDSGAEPARASPCPHSPAPASLLPELRGHRTQPLAQLPRNTQDFKNGFNIAKEIKDLDCIF